jgi:uncharacterized protein (DUF302 family)
MKGNEMTKLRNRPINLFLFALGVLILAFTQSHTALAAGDVVVQKINAPFSKVVTKLKREIASHKLVIVKIVPYQKMIAMVGVKTEPMMGFEIFHPRYGKQIYQNDITATKDAPLRMVVRASGSSVLIEYRKPSAVFSGYKGLGKMSAELDTLLADVVARVAK